MTDLTEYMQEWLEIYEAHAKPAQAVQMAAYMKHKFEFLGMKAPERRALGKEFLKTAGFVAFEELPKTIQLFWECPYRDAQYFAMELPMKYKKQWTPELLSLLEEMVVQKSWWDTVDYIASTLVGTYFRKFPEQIPVHVPRWVASPNMWLNRAAIIFQLKYKEDTDWALLQQSMTPHIASKEFFHRKAIGWALRQYARVEPGRVIDFVNSHELSSLSRREALKHLGEQ